MNTDIQNLGLEEAALLLHQFQTQGNVNILPPNFLGQPPPAAQQQQSFDVFNPPQQAMQRMGIAVGSSSTDLPRQPLWETRSRQSLTSANIDPISGYHYPSSASASLPLSPGVPSSKEPNNPTYSTYGQVQAVLPAETQYPSRHQNAGSTSILDNFPGQSALFNPQNVPDLIEGLKVLAASGHDVQSFSLADIVQHLPAEFFLNPSIYADYDSLINALRIIQQYDQFQGATNQDSVDSVASQSQQNLIDLTLSDSNVNQLYNPGYTQQTATDGRPQVVPVRVTQLANTRLTPEVTTALEKFVDNITTAITTFIKDLADAITENPGLLLLGLIPFAFLVFALYQHYGVPSKPFGLMESSYNSVGTNSGGQSSYGRISYLPRRPYDEAEFLARRILTNIDTFENWANAEFPKTGR